MDFCVVTVYSLFAELDKRVAEARRLDLFEQNVGICFDSIRTELDTVVFLWSCRRYRRGRFRSQSRFYIHPESIHALAVLREAVHDVAVIGRDAERVTFAVTDDVLLRQIVLLAEINAELDRFGVDLIEIRSIGQAVLANLKTDIAEIVGIAL